VIERLPTQISPQFLDIALDPHHQISTPFAYTSLPVSHFLEMKSLEVVSTLPIQESFDVSVSSLTRLLSIKVTQGGFLDGTTRMVEIESMNNVSISVTLRVNITQGCCDGDQPRLVETDLSLSALECAELVNASRPVNKFPPEILLQVFGLVGSGPAILPLAQVCSWWRAIALSSSTLWSVIGERARLVPLFLERSQNSPLHVSGMVTGHGDRQFLDCLPYLKSTIHRVISFEAEFRARPDDPFACLEYAAPALERLSIIAPPHTSMLTPQTLYTLFAGGMPSLRELMLERCLPWPSCLSPTLTSLTLINTSDLGSCDDLLSALKSCPNVEVLTLLNAIPRMSPWPPEPSSDLPVRLGHLRELYVHSVTVGIYGIADFFSHLSFPTLAPGRTYLAILGWGVRRFGTPPCVMNLLPPVTNLSIAQDTLGSGARLRVKGTACNELVFSVPSPRTLELNRPLLADVNTLTLGPACGGRSSGSNARLLDDANGAWETLFSSMPGLETLVLCKTAISPPLDAIYRLGLTGIAPNLPDCLSRLRHIHLDRCDLEHPSGGGPELPDGSSSLKRLLLHRASLNNPIANITCYNCGPMTLSKETEAELRALVCKFEYATALPIPRVVIPRRVRETMGAVRYRSFGEP
jgi:F-box-like